MDEWRTFLYPLGFLAALLFGARFIVQWLVSEKAQKSIVTPLFWYLSLTGNLLLMLHSLIQIQYFICVIQACNSVISWRNLNLMTSPRSMPLRSVVYLLLSTFFLITILFWYISTENGWFRVPTTPWQLSSHSSISFFWHAWGAVGYFLFSSRFWVQWWLAERAHTSHLSLSFWWISLVGALISISYFLRIGDSVNLIGPLLGVVPYIRNLMIIQKAKRAKT